MVVDIWSLFWVVLFSMLPISELRGGIPLAYFGFDWPIALAYVVCVIANIFPVPFILKFFHIAEKRLRKYPTFARFFDWLDRRTRRRVKDKVEKYGALGLILFVAIPLPVTGAWTGAFGAYIFDIDFKKAMASIIAGVLIAGIIVTLITIFCLAPTSVQAEEEFDKNKIELFLGGASAFRETGTDSGFAVGLSYEYRLVQWVGIGMIGEYATGDVRDGLLLFPVYIHPWRGLRFDMAPGVEFSDEPAAFAVRFGLGYDIELWRSLSLMPEVNADIVDGETTLVYGVSLGWGF